MKKFQVTLLLASLPLLSGCFLMQALGKPVGDSVPYNPKDVSGDVAVRQEDDW